MRVYKFLCIPATAADDRTLRDQVYLGARYRRQIALIENRARTLQRGIADRPALNVPEKERSAWWKSVEGKAARDAWYASDECKMLRDMLFAEKKRALKVARDAAIEAGIMWGTCGKADDAADFARRAVDKNGLIDEDGQTTFVDTHFPADVGRIAVQFQKGNERIDTRTGKKIPAKKLVYADDLIGGEDTRLRIGTVAYALAEPVDGFRPAAIDTAGKAIDVYTRGLSAREQDLLARGQREAAITAYAARTPASIDPSGNVHKTPEQKAVTKIARWERGERDEKGKRYHSLAIRVGTMPGTIRPIWAHLHVMLHQNPRSKNQLVLGHDVVKWAVIRRERTGLRYRWFLTLETEGNVEVTTPHPHPHDTVAVHIGWRQLFETAIDARSRDDLDLTLETEKVREKAGIRVLTWSASAPLDPADPASPREGQLVLPEDVLGQKPFADGIHSVRDKNQDVLRDMILVYARSLPTSSWLRVEAQHMHQWRAPGKYVRLYHQWKDQRIHGDQAAFAALEAWIKQDRHLLHREAPSIDRMKRQIEGRVTQIAVQLAKRYGVVASDNIAVGELIEKDARHDEDEQKLRKKSARRVNVVAPGEARAIVRYFAKKYGCVGLEIDAAGGTIDCDACGHRRDVAREDRAQRIIRCESCGHVEDQDLTMSRNLLAGASAVARGESGWPLEPKVSGPSAKKKASVRRNRRRGQQPLAGDTGTP
jgi:hypothetical protein